MSVASTVPVLMYHHVRPGAGMIATTPEHFEDQLKWLAKNGYTTLTTAQFARHLQGEGVPRRSILLTFDDGYLDNWVYAYPLLKKYGFKATIFLVTSWIQDGPLRPILGQEGLPDTPEHRACEVLIEQGRSDEAALRWSEIRAMRESGLIEFHSHTHTHTRWDLSERAAAKDALMSHELAQSRAALATHLGEVSDHFCWPQGHFDADYVRIAQAAGFRYLYTTQAFGQNKAGSDPANIYRFAVRNTTGASVGRRIRIAAHPVIGPLFNGWKKWQRSRRRAP